MSDEVGYKLFRVKRGQQATTVSIDPALVIRAGKKLGLSGVTDVVNSAASEYRGGAPGDTCSGYVARRLEQAMAAAAAARRAAFVPCKA